ncbi:MAG: transaldolase family protein, partial [Candidatus Omnitrophica bacterium]|nr:transaldolase family protein [Candidatus Omnitrophota bacterium]
MRTFLEARGGSYDVSSRQHVLPYSLEGNAQEIPTLMITDVDLTGDTQDGSRKDYLFGRAYPSCNITITSAYRFEHSSEEIFIARNIKNALHEAGHLFGLGTFEMRLSNEQHCADPSCVMSFSPTVKELDETEAHFCPACRQHLLRLARAAAAPQTFDNGGKADTSVISLYNPRTKGTSFGLDDFGRGYSQTGLLQEMIHQGGVMDQTSNPAIFLNSLKRGLYDSDIIKLVSLGNTPEQIYNILYTQEALDSARLFKSLYTLTDGLEGRVARETDPRCFKDIQAIIQEASFITQAAQEQGIHNLLVKIAATPGSNEAIRKSLINGSDILVTLIFTELQYLESVEAYIEALEARLNQGKDITRAVSLCAFFVSRIDKKIDSLIDKKIAAIEQLPGTEDSINTLKLMKGKVAIAHMKKMYQIFEAIFFNKDFSDPANLYANSQGTIDNLRARFARLQEKGAQPQRVLIASSSTKSPEYSPMLYVFPFLGPYLQNTLGNSTLEDLRKRMHKITRVRDTIFDDIPLIIQTKENQGLWDNFVLYNTADETITADEVLSNVKKAGFDLRQVGNELLDEGVQLFIDAQNNAVSYIAQRIEIIRKRQREALMLKALSELMRLDIVKMITKAGSGHPGGSLSCVEMIVASYLKMMNVDASDPDWSWRSRFILSKGHAAATVYAILSRLGFFPQEELNTLRKFNTRLHGMVKTGLPGIDFSTGTLGQGVSAGVGMALGAKMTGKNFKTIVVIGDGEEQEGQIAEAARHAARLGLDNLIVFFDINGYQIDGATRNVDVADREMVWKGYGFNVISIADGNDIEQILMAIEKLENDKAAANKPTVFITYTTKGKGVSYMEGTERWHGKAPKKDSEETLALQEIEARLCGISQQLGIPREALDDVIQNYLSEKRLAQEAKQTLVQQNPEKIAPAYGGSFTLSKLQPGEKIATRKAFGEMLVQLGIEYPNLVATSADLTGSIMMADFAKAFPDRYIATTGIREAHMASMAAGLSTVGLIPVIATYDMYHLNTAPQVRHMAHNHHPVLIVSSHCGISHTEDGESHQGTETPGLMDIFSGSPTEKLLESYEPADAQETRMAMRLAIRALQNNTPVYLRLARSDSENIDRSNVPGYQENYQALVAQGAYTLYGTQQQNDAVIVASGTTVAPALAAAQALKEQGYNIKVINAVSLDKINGQSAIVELLRHEEGVPILTLYNGVAHILQGKVALAVKEANIAVGRIVGKGITRYGSGKAEQLWTLNGLDKDGIIKTMKEELLADKSLDNGGVVSPIKAIMFDLGGTLVRTVGREIVDGRAFPIYEEIPGLPELLSLLKKAGYLIYIFSGANEKERDYVLKDFPFVRENIERFIIASEVGGRNNFTEVLNILQLSLDSVVYVDDTDAGYYAAREAGIKRAIKFDSIDQLKKALTDFGIVLSDIDKP